MTDTEVLQSYRPKQKIRIVTATALFDGHDASINIMRRLLQDRGAEVIHLGHNRSAMEIVSAVIQEDAQAVAISSYQGGHVEFFKYIRELLDQAGGKDVKIFGGGGGVIVPREIEDLHRSGISKIFSPSDGQILGLQGIIGYILRACDFEFQEFGTRDSDRAAQLGRALTLLEQNPARFSELADKVGREGDQAVVIGITGTGGAGKSSITDELISRFVFDHPDVSVALVCVDPSKRKTGGALLGDRIRINSASHTNVFVRSFATRGSGAEISGVTQDAAKLLARSGFDIVFVETSGIGQGDAKILGLADISLYVMTPEYGAATQLEKIDMLDFADLIAINKFERRQALDAIRDVRTLLRRSRMKGVRSEDKDFPVFGTIASRFEDDGVNGFYRALCEKINLKLGRKKFQPAEGRKFAIESSSRHALIPGERIFYLSTVVKAVRAYHRFVAEETAKVKLAESLDESAKYYQETQKEIALADELVQSAKAAWSRVDESVRQALELFDDLKGRYDVSPFVYEVRGKKIEVESKIESLSHLSIPKVATPNFMSRAEIAKYLLFENLPGYFPFTAGLFPFRRLNEDPKRQFAGEGGPRRTNERFHYLSKRDPAKRLSTAFDSVTLYGADPQKRPDIYGKVGESGVSIAHLGDMKELFAGFDLCSPNTSVSMTINGPAPIILAMFLNTAIDQEIDKFRKDQGEPNAEQISSIRANTLAVVRGTVQADILKEDQAQNTCIFSTEFALKLMGDMQEYFIRNKIRNYYSVSISGYHIAEAGANPITQLAFTLANGFTYVEYYLARGMKIDDFAPNLSFFFSNGLDPEYSVIGRVARRIWAIAMRDIYGASERSQKLKYHIQTSGRSLHAQEIDFNDIRTTLQALLALYDNCNSLHTNAYDEAITTPTEESVRRAMAIQLIINKELGTNKSENINQGSYFLEDLTNLVEEAVLEEFERLSSRGGVLGSMETQYQRNKIQEESLYYESLKDSGELPIIGVNTYLNPNQDSHGTGDNIALIRASYEEKDDQIKRLDEFRIEATESKREEALHKLALAVIGNSNIFAELMTTVRYASLGDICNCLYKVGGQYRRSM